MESFVDAMTTFFAYLIAIAFYSGAATIAYNAIAWEFNLPQFNYWIITCAFLTINGIRKGLSASGKNGD